MEKQQSQNALHISTAPRNYTILLIPYPTTALLLSHHSPSSIPITARPHVDLIGRVDVIGIAAPQIDCLPICGVASAPPKASAHQSP
jgi:hypothetical protein